MTGFLPRYFLVPTSAVAHGVGPTYAAWLLGLMNGLSILGRVGIGYLADRLGKSKALSASFLLCGLGHIVFWLPAVAISSSHNAEVNAMFTAFVVFVGIFGSVFISLFPVVVSHYYGKEELASKTGLLNSAIGLSTLAGPSAIYAIIGDGEEKHWTTGVAISGGFLLIGGLILGVGFEYVYTSSKHTLRK